MCRKFLRQSRLLSRFLYLGSLVTSDQDLLVTLVLPLLHFDRNHQRYRSSTTAPSQRISPYQTHSPPALGQPGAMSDFFFSLSFPFSQILTTVVNSRVTAPSHISFPSNVQLDCVTRAMTTTRNTNRRSDIC